MRGGISRAAGIHLRIEERGADEGGRARETGGDGLVWDLALQYADLGQVGVEARTGPRDEVDHALCEDAFLLGELVDLGVRGGDLGGEVARLWGWRARRGG